MILIAPTGADSSSLRTLRPDSITVPGWRAAGKNRIQGISLVCQRTLLGRTKVLTLREQRASAG